jgi:hypothetical protein
VGDVMVRDIYIDEGEGEAKRKVCRMERAIRITRKINLG